ncbi:hypothetical protein QBC36DRAFT_65949 [Triangularia setosa]|uniref:Uncharacterized protein n=1 Tax=Triangularia setosa TaxID=2587417 RepID=A0AAN7AAN8_9PEZI|nr:hypothetical protein QBC36DRAFT_65949 [Podospora setosa]
MKSIVALSILATLATASPAPVPGISARTWGECSSGVSYCGHTLLNIGWSRELIMTTISNAPSWLGVDSLENVLFNCVGGSWLTFIKSCNAPGTCVDTGAGNSDYCS